MYTCNLFLILNMLKSTHLLKIHNLFNGKQISIYLSTKCHNKSWITTIKCFVNVIRQKNIMHKKSYDTCTSAVPYAKTLRLDQENSRITFSHRHNPNTITNPILLCLLNPIKCTLYTAQIFNFLVHFLLNIHRIFKIKIKLLSKENRKIQSSWFSCHIIMLLLYIQNHSLHNAVRKILLFVYHENPKSKFAQNTKSLLHVLCNRHINQK